MIATWMLSAVLFTGLVGLAAHCAEVALRSSGRPARWVWLAALAASTAWPTLAPWIRRTLATNDPVIGVAQLPSIQIVPDAVRATMPWGQRVDTMLLALWALASLIMVVRIVRGVVLLRRIKSVAEPRVIDGVPVLVSGSVGPAVVGVLAPSVLYPAALLDLDASLRRLVLRHELEHCRARDPWLVLGSAVVLALVPWNVPLWWIARRARLALEIDCDARVLSSGGDAIGYGQLLMLISQRQATTALAPMLAESTSHLERRIVAMREAQLPRRSLRVVIGVLGAVIVVGAACVARIGDRVAGPAATKVAATKATLPVNAGQPYFEFQVEQQARQIPGTGNIRYPDSLKGAGVEGEVLAQFVVDTNGVVETGSFRELKSTHPLFTAAVAKALPNMRFAPARVGDAPVRQVVQQPFTFALAKETGNAPTANGVAPAKRVGYSEFKLTRMARQIPGVGTLRYPDVLRSANISGEVIAMFVVNPDGLVDPSTLKVVKSDHQLFTEAVKNALPDIRFEPPMVEGRAVKQLVQQAFSFSLHSDGSQVTTGANNAVAAGSDKEALKLPVMRATAPDTRAPQL